MLSILGGGIYYALSIRLEGVPTSLILLGLLPFVALDIFVYTRYNVYEICAQFVEPDGFVEKYFKSIAMAVVLSFDLCCFALGRVAQSANP